MKHRFTVCVLLVFLASSLAGGFLNRKVSAKPEADEDASREAFLTNFSEALDVIQRNYVDYVHSDRLVYSAIKGMLRSLDPHSNFLDPQEFASLREDQHSRYYGLGIRVRPLLRDRGRVAIVEPPLIGTPAEKKGLQGMSLRVSKGSQSMIGPRKRSSTISVDPGAPKSLSPLSVLEFANRWNSLSKGTKFP